MSMSGDTYMGVEGVNEKGYLVTYIGVEHVNEWGYLHGGRRCQ